MPSEPGFSLCLTHDVDRVYKTFQAPYEAVVERDPSRLASLVGESPYWQFEHVMDIEQELGVRSSFYFLDEQRVWERPLREWLAPSTWIRYTGRYDLEDPAIVDAIHRLDEGGWEVGLHGSFESYHDRGRLAAEKARLESVLGHPVAGIRQHYLNLDGENTWRHHAAVGFSYDTSPGSSTENGFAHGYRPFRPFDDEFVVFPLTLMESSLPDPGDDFDAAWERCEALLEEAAANDAVMTVLWHPRYFNEEEFPGYAPLYRRLVEAAAERGAWIGPPGDLYEQAGLGEAPANDGGAVSSPSDPSSPTASPDGGSRAPGKREITNTTGAPDGSE